MIVLLATRQEIPKTVVLLNESFRTPVDEATWEWYAYGNPFGATRVYLAVDREQSVGVFAFTPVPLRICGEPITASSGHHLCLKAAYQGGPSFVALSRHALKNEEARQVRLALGLPNRRSYQPQKVLMKWDDFCFLDCLYKACPAPCEHACRQMGRFTDAFDRFYERLNRDLDFYIEKNTAWMNWRFFGRPGRPYAVYAFEQDSELDGYVVLKRWQEPDGSTKAHIIDLHALNPSALSNLLAAAENYAAGCRELNLWAAPGYPYRALIEASGFVGRGEARQPLIAKTLQGVPLVFPGGSSSFSYADGDFVY